MTPLAPLLTGFMCDYMPRQRAYSPHTCDAYAHSFKLLLEFAGQQLKARPSQLQLEQLDAPLILQFLENIEDKRHNAAVTRNLRLAAIKTFMHYVEYRVPSALAQIGQICAIPNKRHEQKLIRHLTIGEVKAILNAPDLTTRLGIRDRAMLHLCFSGGLRVSELVGLTIERLLLGHTMSMLIHGKGRKERHMPLWKEAATDVRAWLAVRGQVQAPELFVNAQGRVCPTAFHRGG